MSQDDEEVLPPTLTPTETAELGTTPQDKRILPWGRLVTCQMFLTSVDLAQTFTFGRSESCSVSLMRRNCPPNLIHSVSKVHFQIEKRDDNLVYLTDRSKNGTFLNKIKLGLDKCVILKAGDEIAVSSVAASNVVYIFFPQGMAPDEFLPPELSEKFACIKQLGRGACGEVRLVKHRETLNHYAIKKIILSESRTSQIHKINHPVKVQNEIAILSKLSHPCVIGMHNFLEVGDRVFLILQYMQGGELTRRILDWHMSEDLAKFYFFQMLSATQYLHSQGVIHRDLKPENILLLDDREETLLKISDFGLSKITENSLATTMCGTLKYVAPEVISNTFRDGGEYGKAADVWSLGVILYFMVSQTLPFEGADSKTVIDNILKGEFSLTSGVWSAPDELRSLKDLVCRMLQPKPDMRINTGEIFNHDWLKFDHCVKFRVRRLARAECDEGLMENLLEPTPKKFRFSFATNSGSLTSESGGGLQDLSPTICCQ